MIHGPTATAVIPPDALAQAGDAALKADAGIARRARDYFDNRFVYAVISERARGLSIGVNMNPDRACNFDCIYCEVNRRKPVRDTVVNLGVLCDELKAMLERVQQGRVRELPGYQTVPAELLDLKEVALSGDGEPTMCPNFAEVVQALVHLRAQGSCPPFKMVLITNATGLDQPAVRRGLHLFTAHDEVWAKLDVGTQEAMRRINRTSVSLKKVLHNILLVARERPVVIQSLFPLIAGIGPSDDEVEEYVQRLRELKEAGAQISLVQVYSAHRAAILSHCGHLPLKHLSRIVHRVREVTGLKAEVF
jgi:wyosine [tRNA(Phe)-imidazoG37] synthetase (radical SAM superfamily)